MGKALKKYKEKPGLRVTDLSYLYPDIPDCYKGSNGLPVWEQQPNECPVNFFYFQIFRDLGPTRSLLQAKMMGMRISEQEQRNWKKYAEKEWRSFTNKIRDYHVSHRIARTWAWADRAKLYDDYIEWKCNILADDPLKAKRHELKIVQEIRLKALEKLRKTPLSSLSVNAAITLLELTHRHERVLRGKSAVDMFGAAAMPNKDFVEDEDEEDFEGVKEIDWNKVPADLLEKIVDYGTGKYDKEEQNADVKAVVVKTNGYTNGNGKHNGSSR